MKSTTAVPSVIYAMGRIAVPFPSLSTEKQFAQLTSDTGGLINRQALQKCRNALRKSESLPDVSIVLDDDD